MQMETSQVDYVRSIGSVNIEKAKLDLNSVKVQMALGTVLIACACLVSYWNTLEVGFLLDDFLHLDYVARALQGNWHDFAQNFYGNWAGSDIMRSYRPLASLSIFIDYALWGVHAWGFHLSNLVLLFGCCLLLSLITLEITGLFGNRLGAQAAVWAGLLFAVYPLHAESVSWIIGRVDLLCTLFFLASLFAYLRFRLLKEEPYWWASVLFFFGSLFSKEMAVTLPAVITLAEVCLSSKLEPKSTSASGAGKRLSGIAYAMPFWALLGIYFTLRVAILGTAVGGYGNDGLSTFLSSFHNFLDKSSLLKILIPANEEGSIPAWLRPDLLACYLVSLLLLALRVARRWGPISPVLFLLASMAITVLPTFQIWHIYPNLVGSRLFFLSSAFFCVLLSLSALPAMDAIGRSQAKILSGLGVTVLVGIFLGWSSALSKNLDPWLTAGRQMTLLPTQVTSLVSAAKPAGQVILLNLPRDFSGAGMLTRPQYLEILLRPPFSRQDISKRVVTIEPPVAGSHDFMWPNLFRSMIGNDNRQAVYKWSTKPGKFVAWQRPGGASSYEFKVDGSAWQKMTAEPADTLFISGDKWSVRSPQRPAVEQHPGFLRIYPGAEGITLWLPAVDVDPLAAPVAIVDMVLASSMECQGCLDGKVKLVWSSEEQSSAALQNVAGHKLAWVGRYRTWSLNGPVSRLGLRIEPGNYGVDFAGLKVIAASSFVPRLRIIDAGASSAGPLDLWQHRVDSPQKTAFVYDASGIPGLSLVKLIISPPGTTFDANVEAEVMSEIPSSTKRTDFKQIIREEPSGLVALPEGIARSPGLHQARLIPLDKNQQAIGLPSEPVSFYVR